MKESAAPQATRLVREEMGCGLRDGEEGVVELPPSLSKSSVCRRFCEERGWNASMTPRGLGVPVAKEGTEQLTVCGWSKFRTCWKEQHPGLCIRPPGKDICDACCIFQNSFRFISCQHKTAADNEVDLEPSVAMLERERLVTAAGEHAAMATAMKQHCKMKVNEAIQTAFHPHEERSCAIVIDHSQNCGLPHLGETQPGKTHCCSPLRVNIFGIVDCSIPGGKLSACVHTEADGGKGANNVVSLVMKFLIENRWLKGTTGKELTVIADNCPGQNKNNTTLRLALCLVEKKFFKRCTFAFHIAGHTKNCCDGWFNRLKAGAARCNPFTMDEIKQKFEQHEDVTVTTATAKDFCDCASMFNHICRKLDESKGFVQRDHVFAVFEKFPTNLTIARSGLARDVAERKSFKMKLLKRKKKDGSRPVPRIEFRDHPKHLKQLPEPGLADIKMTELGTKF